MIITVIISECNEEKMKVLGIAGSPRQEGNTCTLLREALKGAAETGAETELLFIPGLKINPCRECGGCDNTGKCAVDDGMQAVYPKFRDADRFIVASPIFFGGVTANLKAMIDRCQCLWVRKYILKQPVSAKTNRGGVFISACGGKKTDFFQAASLTIKAFFITLDVAYSADLFFPGIDSKGAITKHPTALRDAFKLGSGLCG